MRKREPNQIIKEASNYSGRWGDEVFDDGGDGSTAAAAADNNAGGGGCGGGDA